MNFVTSLLLLSILLHVISQDLHSYDNETIRMQFELMMEGNVQQLLEIHPKFDRNEYHLHVSNIDSMVNARNQIESREKTISINLLVLFLNKHQQYVLRLR